jgi:hypothetical protein
MSDSLLDQLGALREERASQTTHDFALPGFQGRLWGTFRLPDGVKASQLAALVGSGNPSALSASMDLLGRANTGLYTYSGALMDDEDLTVRDDDGALNPGFEHLPEGTDEMPVSFSTPALERVSGGKLCPPRPGGKEHTAETRARALFGRDALVIASASALVGWALGAGAQLSETFRGRDEPAA